MWRWSEAVEGSGAEWVEIEAVEGFGAECVDTCREVRAGACLAGGFAGFEDGDETAAERWRGFGESCRRGGPGRNCTGFGGSRRGILVRHEEDDEAHDPCRLLLRCF